MSKPDQDTRGTESRAEELELNKETLRDLDVSLLDQGNVKGGGLSGSPLSQTCVAKAASDTCVGRLV